MSAGEANGVRGRKVRTECAARARRVLYGVQGRLLVLPILAVALSACTFDPEPGHRVRVDIHNACGASIQVLVGEAPDSFRATEPSDGMYKIPVAATVTLPEALVPPVAPYLYLWVVSPSARDTGSPVRFETDSLATTVDNSGLTHYQIDVAGPVCP